jgi:hypothetical protein
VECISSFAGDGIDAWIETGLAIAGLPDSAYWHGALKAQAWIESGFEPDIAGMDDSNSAIGQRSMGLEQVIPMAWASTATGKIYPFFPCAFDPALSVAVRAELFAMGYFN